MSPLKCPSCRLSLPPNWGGLTDPKGRCPYCGKPLTSAKDLTPTPTPVAVNTPTAAGSKTILWGAGAAHPERTPPLRAVDQNQPTPGVVPTSKDRTPPPVHVSSQNQPTPGVVPTSKDRTPPPVHVSSQNQPTPGVVPTSKDRTPPPVHVSSQEHSTPGVVPTSKDRTPPPVHVSSQEHSTPGVVPAVKEITPSPVQVPEPRSTSPEVQPANSVAAAIAPTIQAPAIHPNAIPHKPVITDFPIEEDVVFTPSVVVPAPRVPTSSPDTAAPILAVLAASQELSLSDVEPASSEHHGIKGQGVNPAEEITAIDPPLSDSLKNVPEWIVGGNESYGLPQQRKIGLFVGLGIGLFIMAGIVFIIARGKEKPSHTTKTAPSLAMQTETQGNSDPKPLPTPYIAPKPSTPPAPAAIPVAAEMPVAPGKKPVAVEETTPALKAPPVEKPRDIVKPVPKTAVAEQPVDKPIAAARTAPSVNKPVRSEKAVGTEKLVASASPFAKTAEAPKGEPKAEKNLIAKNNNEEKQQKAVEAYQRGNSKLFKGNLVEAIADFKLAIRLNPKEPTPYRGLGLANAQQGKAGEAVRNLKRYLTLAPKAADRALIEKRIQQLQ